MSHSHRMIPVLILSWRSLTSRRWARTLIIRIHLSCNHHPSHTKVTGHSTGSCLISEWTSPRPHSTA